MVFLEFYNLLLLKLQLVFNNISMKYVVSGNFKRVHPSLVNSLLTVYCKEIYFDIAVLSKLGLELGICGGNGIRDHPYYRLFGSMV